MPATSVIRVVGVKEAQALLEQVSGAKLNARMRRGLRRGAKVFREKIRAEARRPGIPATFRRTRTRAHRNPLGVSVSPGSPLSTIFEHGAGRHAIGAAGQILHSQQGERLFAARGPVSHPGMAARPVVGPAYAAGEAEASAAVGAELMRGIE